MTGSAQGAMAAGSPVSEAVLNDTDASAAPDLVQHEGVAHDDDLQRGGAAGRQRYRAALQPAGAHVPVVRPLDLVARLHLGVPPATMNMDMVSHNHIVSSNFGTISGCWNPCTQISNALEQQQK